MARSPINEALRILYLNPEPLANVRTSEHVSKSGRLEVAKEPDLESQRALLQQAQAEPAKRPSGNPVRRSGRGNL